MKPVFSLALILLVSCGHGPSAQQPEFSEKTENTITLSEQQKRNAKVLCSLPEKRSISSTLKVNGSIDVPPQNRISISVPLGGYLKSTQLLPGMQVRKGEVIAEMEDQQYIQLQQDFLTAVSRLAFLEKDYNRQKELNANKASSDKIFQQTEADYKVQRVLVRALHERLKLIGIEPDQLSENSLSRSINIRAPIDGFVSAVDVNIGKYVTPSEVLFELVNPTDIHLTLTVFEKDLDKIFIGQKVEAYTNHEPQKRYKCEVILVSQNVGMDRSAEVHCHFEQYDQSLKPGMYMNAEIQVKTDTALALPDEAVVLFENKYYVFQQTAKNSFSMLEVKPGVSENGFTEITSPLDPKANYVVKGAYAVLMAMKNRAED